MQNITAERDSPVSTNTVVKTSFKRLQKKAGTSQTDCRELHLLAKQSLSHSKHKADFCIARSRLRSNFNTRSSRATLLGAHGKTDVFRTRSSTQGNLKRPFSLDFQPVRAEKGIVTVGKLVACSSTKRRRDKL